MYLSIPTFLCAVSITLCSFDYCVADVENPILFSNQNFYLKFNLPPSPIEGLSKEYSENETQILNKTSERFHNFFNFFECKNKDERGISNMAVASAYFNNQLRTTDKRRVTFLYFTALQNYKNDGCTDKSQFEEALSVSNKANAIYSGTVEYLIIYDFMYISPVEKMQTYLNESRNKLHNNSYKLGVIISLSTCENKDKFVSLIAPVLSTIDMILFFKHPVKAQYIDGPEKTIKTFYNQFKSCENQVRAIENSIEIAFATKWSSKVDGKTNYSNQVYFWREMNTWAETTNTKIFLDEAFDNTEYYDIATEAGLGWWQQVPSNNDANYFSYDDKETLAEKERKEMVVAISTSPNLGLLIGTPVGIFSSIICILTLVYFLIYKRKNRQLLSDTELKTFRKKLDDSDIRFDEIPQKLFAISENLCLGSGEYGLVCRATVTKNDEEVDVAAKMTKQPCNIIVLRSLLSELKILAAIGNHDNIIGLVGAYMEEIRKNKLVVFLELCEAGTLENYLRNSNELGFDENIGKNLLRWSYEICCGMEHVASKNIVHMDIAARNVLLSTNLTAKISDFGLSRRLYNYQMYTKKNQEPLPWRWMSPESLQRLQFTEKSDVWSFGVTLWEMFSLGGLPYAGIRWDTNFSSNLVAGLRLAEPQFNPNNIFNEVTAICWDLSPDDRPTFKHLKAVFEEEGIHCRLEGINDISIQNNTSMAGFAVAGYSNFIDIL